MFVQVHINTMEHTKTRRLCRRLKINQREALGFLTCLWVYALKESPDGVFHDRSNEDIADALCYDDDPEKLVSSLVDVGFLYRTDEDVLAVYDWSEHTGKAMTFRAKNRERQRRYRSRKRNGDSDVTSHHEVEKEKEQEEEQEKKKIKKRKKATPKNKKSLDEILITKKEIWLNKYGETLDGKQNRPSLDEVIETAWEHQARKKYSDPTRYLENWIRKEAQYWSKNKNLFSRNTTTGSNNTGSFGPWLDEGFATREEWEASKCKN